MMTTTKFYERTYAFPYGLTNIAPALCTVIGLIFFHVAAFGCNTFKIESRPTFESFDSSSSSHYSVGYFRAGPDGACFKFIEDNGDLPVVVRFGRFVGILGAIMAWTILAVVTMAACVQYPRPKLVFTTVGAGMAVMSLFSFLLLSGKSYDDDLKVASGGVLAILGAFVWMGGAVAIALFMTERPRLQVASAAAAAVAGVTGGSTPEQAAPLPSATLTTTVINSKKAAAVTTGKSEPMDPSIALAKEVTDMSSVVAEDEAGDDDYDAEAGPAFALRKIDP